MDAIQCGALMISPVVFKKDESYDDFYGRHIETKDLFALQEGKLLILLDMGKTAYIRHIKFALWLEVGRTYFTNNGETSSREEFVDYVSQNYPDHFDWMLFNIVI